MLTYTTLPKNLCSLVVVYGNVPQSLIEDVLFQDLQHEYILSVIVDDSSNIGVYANTFRLIIELIIIVFRVSDETYQIH